MNILKPALAPGRRDFMHKGSEVKDMCVPNRNYHLHTMHRLESYRSAKTLVLAVYDDRSPLCGQTFDGKKKVGAFLKIGNYSLSTA